MDVHQCRGCAPAKSGQPITADRNAGKTAPSLVRRVSDLLRWMIPAALLAILPKCPLCIAAYIALGTGIGVSVATAAHIRALLLAVSLSALAYLGVRRLSRFMAVHTGGR